MTILLFSNVFIRYSIEKQPSVCRQANYFVNKVNQCISMVPEPPAVIYQENWPLQLDVDFFFIFFNIIV